MFTVHAMYNTGAWSLVLSLFLIFGTSDALAQLETQFCDPVAQNQITLAYNIINNNIDALFTDYRTHRIPQIDDSKRDKVLNSIDRKEQKIKTKLSKLKIKCKDDQGMCINSDRAGRTEPKKQRENERTIKVCYYNHAGSNANNIIFDQCELVDTIIHEVGHLVDLPKLPGHNDAGAVIRSTDPIWLLGKSGRTICEKVSSNPLLPGLSSLLGTRAECSVSDQCASGKCYFEKALGRNVCGCTTDQDCIDARLGIKCGENRKCKGGPIRPDK